MGQSDNSLTALLAEKSASKTPRGRQRGGQKNPLNERREYYVTCYIQPYNTVWTCERLCPAGRLNEQSITTNALVPVRTYLSI